MITTPTTFVIGAGASKDYGLPISSGLRAEAHGLRPRHSVYHLILSAELCTPDKLNAILDDLRNQGTQSIDEFLFARRHDKTTMDVGRVLIALLLARRLPDVKLPDSLGTKTMDWLGYIINKMCYRAQNCKEFIQGNTEVRFVTFNFDSIIEDRLKKAILNLYRGNPEGQLREAVDAICNQIIHVHGKLPPLPSQPLPQEFSDPITMTRSFSEEWLTYVSLALSDIRIVTDESDPDTLTDTQQAVRRSKILCFLGFAYADENLAKLDPHYRMNLNEDLDPRYNKSEFVNREIYGTAFRMRPGEKETVEHKLAGVTLGGEDEICQEFLRNQHIFRD